MIIKKRAKVGWHENDDRHVTILNRLIDLRDSGGKRVVALSPDPRHRNLLKEACGTRAKSRAVPTPGDKKADDYDERCWVPIKQQHSDHPQ